MRIKRDAVRKAQGRKGNATSTQDGSLEASSPEEIPVVALNNANFQEAADMYWTELRAKRLKTNRATQGEECELPKA